MNGSILLGARDSTNMRIESILGEDIALLFGQDYQQQKSQNYQRSEAIQEVISKLVHDKVFGDIDPLLKEHLLEIQTLKDDSCFVQTDFDSYEHSQNSVDKIFTDQNEFCRRCLTALAKCGDLSCDNSIVSYCQSVWNIKSVEVPNPSLNPVQRVRSHSYLHLQESGSLEGAGESYHSNMFNLEENVGTGEINQGSQKSGESFEKLYRNVPQNQNLKQGFPSHDQIPF